MGTTESKQKLGERVQSAKAKLMDEKRTQFDKYEQLKSSNPKVLDEILKGIEVACGSCAPFLESTLILSWIHDEKKCREIVLAQCNKVFTAPIDPIEYKWFQTYLFPSSIWFMKIGNESKYMYEELLFITEQKSVKVTESMDAILTHLRLHPKWSKILEIPNQSRITRQDHGDVGLLRDQGIRSLMESKIEEHKDDDLKGVMDFTFCVDILTNVATKLNGEFQNYMKSAMSEFCDFAAGPIKQVDRCQSKLEQDYPDAIYPRCAHLLDLVRCSLTFNTVEQLLMGYEKLCKHLNGEKSQIKLARVKNQFLDEKEGGYKDIKVNVIFESRVHKECKIIAEIQLILNNYLHEKKKMHKLYKVLREKTFFEMVLLSLNPVGNKTSWQFAELISLPDQVSMASYKKRRFTALSFCPGLDLLACNGDKWFGIVDLNRNTVIFDLALKHRAFSGQNHAWLQIKKQKYIAVQTSLFDIQFFKVIRDPQSNKFEFMESKEYAVQKNEIIQDVAFDSDQNIVLAFSGRLEKISIEEGEVTAAFEFEPTRGNLSSQMALSEDGSRCVVAGGSKSHFFFLFDFFDKTKQKVMLPEASRSAFAPCFINGDRDSVAIGDSKGKVHVFDLSELQPKKERELKYGSSVHINCLASRHNWLVVPGAPVARTECTFQIFDTKNWNCFYVGSYMVGKPYSIALSKDSKYLAFSGKRGAFVQKLKPNAM